MPFEHVKEPAHLAWLICNNNERPVIPDDCPETLSNLMKKCWELDWTKRPGIDHVLALVK